MNHTPARVHHHRKPYFKELVGQVAPQALPDARMKRHFKSWNWVGSILGNFTFVGWVEPASGFVGFRCTLPNLHFDGVVVKCETQQRPISETKLKSASPLIA